MTVTELLVAVVVLIILILVFNMVLAQSQKVVAASQGKMRTNSTLASIAEVMRTDLRRVTKSGFLCITRARNSNSPQLFFTAAGPSPSIRGNETGTTSVVGYGLCNNNFGALEVLSRAALVLKDGTNAEDIWRYDLATFLPLTRRDVNNLIVNGRLTGANPLIPIQLPESITTIDDVRASLKYLAGNCTALSITWTDGTKTSDVLNWYGVDYVTDADGNVDAGIEMARDDNWNNNDVDETEFDAGGNTYRALWTHHDQNNWPKAIKIRFRITTDAVPGEFKTMDYEVICPLGT